MHGFVATGTMGEAGSLTREERALVVRSVVEAAAGRVPVTVGISSGSARVSLEYAADAKAAGAQYVMSLPPLGYRADEDEVVAFYAALATCGLPVMAYNNPEASGVDMPAALIARIYEEVDGVVADQGVLGRRAPHPRPAAPRRRPRGRRRRRRLGARGLRRRRDRLDHRRAACSRRARRVELYEAVRRDRPGRARATCTVACSPSPAST